MDLDLTRIFVKVVQLGSFSRAADLLRVPKSSVSKAVAKLESETGTKLLIRSTRSLALTPSGRAFYEACLGPVQVLEDARKSLQGRDSVVSGSLKVTAPEDLGMHVISPAIGKLTKVHPGLSFELDYTDEVVDLVKGGYDLAFRLGKLNPSSFKVRKMGSVELVMVASPGYIKASGKLRVPEDLMTHDLLSYRSRAYGSRWALRSLDGKSREIPIEPRILANQMTGLMRMSMAGAGIAFVPSYLCAGEVESGRLVRVLPEWSGPSVPVAMVSPLASSTSARLKIVSDYLGNEVSRALGM
ncbi:MAG: LysR family transcriptional regulator [Bdellovibrionota bacterium]